MDKRILIISSKNEPPFHFYVEYAEAITKILQEDGYQSDTKEDLAILKQQDDLSQYEVIVFCGHHEQRDEQGAEKELERFVHEGKGLVVIHIASSSFQFSLRWRKLVGRVWEYGGMEPHTSDHPPIGPFSVNITNHHHPITKNLDDFEVENDERYQDLLVAPNAITYDLATATLKGRTEPMVWILTPKKGRVFHITLGHELSTNENKSFQELLKRGVAWAAGNLG